MLISKEQKMKISQTVSIKNFELDNLAEKIKSTCITQSHALQTKVHEFLIKQGNGLFILPKTEETMVSFVEDNEDDHCGFGLYKSVVVKGEGDVAVETEKLIGQTYVFAPTGTDFDPEIVCVENTPMLDLIREKGGMPKAVEIDPDEQGQGYMKYLLTAAHNYLREIGREIFITDIGFENSPSLKGFFDFGYIMLAVDHPENDIPLSIMFKLDKWDNISAQSYDPNDSYEIEATDYHGVETLIALGYYPCAMYRKEEEPVGHLSSNPKDKGNIKFMYRCQKVEGLAELLAKKEELEEQAA